MYSRLIILIPLLMLGINCSAQLKSGYKIYNNKTSQPVGSDEDKYDIKHMKVLNIPMDLKISEFCRKLEQRGFSLACDCSETYEGKFDGHYATLTYESNELLNMIISVTVEVKCNDSAEAEKMFREYTKKFATTYRFDKLLTEIYDNEALHDDNEQHKKSRKAFKSGMNQVILTCDYYSEPDYEVYPSISIKYVDYLNDNADKESRY